MYVCVFVFQDEIQQLHSTLGKLYNSERTKAMLERTLAEELKPKLIHTRREVQDHMNRITAANER